MVGHTRLAPVLLLLACGQHRAQQIECKRDLDCSDGLVCDGQERCVGGKCQAGSPPDCSDGIDCTQDLCEEPSGCVHLPNDSACDDGVACTHDECTARGCLSVPVDSACDDGLWCDGRETCSSTGCVPGVPPLNCPTAARPCEINACSEAVHACVTTPVDSDHDGYGAAPCGDDCDDHDPAVHPGAKEVCNQKDDDCDGLVDEERTNSRVDLSEGLDERGGGWPYEAVWNPGGRWLFAWPDVYCAGTAAQAGFAYEERAESGAPEPMGARGWFYEAGYSYYNLGPNFVPTSGGYLASAPLRQQGGTSQLQSFLFSVDATGPSAGVFFPSTKSEPAAGAFGSNGTTILALYGDASGDTYCAEVDAGGARVGDEHLVAVHGQYDFGANYWVPLTWDPHTSLFFALLSRHSGLGTEVVAVFVDSTGALVSETVLPLPGVAYRFTPWMVPTSAGYLVVWQDFDGQASTFGPFFALPLTPAFVPRELVTLGPANDGGMMGLATRGPEVGLFWVPDRTKDQAVLSLLDEEGRRRLPDFVLIPPGEARDTAIDRSKLVASPNGFAVIYELKQRAPIGACAAEPASTHGRAAARLLLCP